MKKRKTFREKLAENPDSFDYADCRPEGASPDYQPPYSPVDLERQERRLQEIMQSQDEQETTER
jgi:hypothetical protein